MPWCDGQQSWSVTYDLDAATLTRTTDETPNSPDGQHGPPPLPGSDAPDPGKHEKIMKPLGADVVATMRTGAAKVLAGGPYEPEYPVPEGTPCTLEIIGADATILLRVDKASQQKKDAANAFIQTL